uniref:Protein aael aael007744 aedes aegypti n=1 Tax=Corethrella appendiculata TaxID=1370023 RepID=U5EDI5_9DIPT
MDLQHPHLLTREQFIQILIERNLNIPNVECMSRDELLILFKKYIMPLPRRPDKNSKNEDNAQIIDNDPLQNRLAIESHCQANKSKHNRITFESDNIKNVSYGVKRIKLNHNGCELSTATSSSINLKPTITMETTTTLPVTKSISLKRQVDQDIVMKDINPKKRQKIIWP